MLTIHNISNPIFWTSNMKIWMKLYSLHYILLLVNQDHLWIWICISLRVSNNFPTNFLCNFFLGSNHNNFSVKEKTKSPPKRIYHLPDLAWNFTPAIYSGYKFDKICNFYTLREEAVLCKMSSIRLKSMFFHGAVAFDLIILIMYIHYFVFFIAHYATL